MTDEIGWSEVHRPSVQSVEGELVAASAVHMLLALLTAAKRAGASRAPCAFASSDAESQASFLAQGGARARRSLAVHDQ